MSVSSEDALVVHDVEGLAIIILVVIVRVSVVSRGVLELLLLPHNLGLGSFESLCHISNF